LGEHALLRPQFAHSTRKTDKNSPNFYGSDGVRLIGGVRGLGDGSVKKLKQSADIGPVWNLSRYG